MIPFLEPNTSICVGLPLLWEADCQDAGISFYIEK
jgi:hypothetical protein